ncbi:MAG: hypothetical protein AAGG01_20760 [Planctomycetota bacterium]
MSVKVDPSDSTEMYRTPEFWAPIKEDCIAGTGSQARCLPNGGENERANSGDMANKKVSRRLGAVMNKKDAARLSTPSTVLLALLQIGASVR